MSFKITPTHILDILIIEPRVFSDVRGYFYESFNERDFFESTGVPARFVQDNHSLSAKGVLRGLHYQLHQAQGKLVRVIKGSVFDVAVDLRQSSKTFCQWVGVELTAENKKQLWIPPGFAHGFLATSDETEFVYKTTDYWCAKSEQCISWDDSTLDIKWPQIGVKPILNTKDQNGLPLQFCPTFA